MEGSGTGVSPVGPAGILPADERGAPRRCSAHGLAGARHLRQRAGCSLAPTGKMPVLQIRYAANELEEFVEIDVATGDHGDDRSASSLAAQSRCHR